MLMVIRELPAGASQQAKVMIAAPQGVSAQGRGVFSELGFTCQQNMCKDQWKESIPMTMQEVDEIAFD